MDLIKGGVQKRLLWIRQDPSFALAWQGYLLFTPVITDILSIFGSKLSLDMQIVTLDDDKMIMDHERSDGFAMDTFSPDYLAVETKDCVRQQRSLDAVRHTSVGCTVIDMNAR